MSAQLEDLVPGTVIGGVVPAKDVTSVARTVGQRVSAKRVPLTPQRHASTSTPSRSARAAQPASVTFTTRLGARSTHPTSTSRVSSAAPIQPARWGRCSDQSMQERVSGRRVGGSRATPSAARRDVPSSVTR